MKIILNNGEIKEATSEEIIEIENAQTKAKEHSEAEKIKINLAKIDKKASGKQKLKDLGLDDDEIQAIMGI
tara:strand:- start:77 stop:289 length:213 start_codon:yes stop_codon:yes gene_type:complete